MPRREACRRRDIGFVPPKCTELGRDGDRDPRIAGPPAIGFVLPKPAQPGGGRDRDPGVAAPQRSGRALQCVECLDRRFPPRQRPPLVAVEPHQAQRDVILGEAFGHDLRADATHPQHVDLRRGDADRGVMARGAGALAGNAPGQLHDLGRQRRIGEHRHVEPVAKGVAGDRRLAGARARASAARRVGAVGGAHRRAGHAGAPRMSARDSRGALRVIGLRPPELGFQTRIDLARV